MSITTSQPSTNLQAEPSPVISDIAASEPPPAVSPAPVNGTGFPPDTFGVSAGSGPTNSGPAAPPPVPAVPSHGPAPSTPSQLAPAAHPPRHTIPPPAHPTTYGQSAPQLQYPGLQSYPGPLPPPSQQPLHYQAHPSQPGYPPSQPAQISYQRQPVQQQNYQPQSSRPLIIDPPRKRSSMGLAVAMPPAHSVSPGFPSPAKDYPAAYPKFSDDLSRNTLAIKQSVPEAVRQAMRDNWEKCLLGSEFHQAFVLNASMHHATPSVQSRAVHDFGRNLVANCKSELVEHFSNRDIDDVADLILAKASNAFLDKALEMRLATIDAKPLLNALARAERLGYDSQDLVEVSHGEHVIPNSRMGQMPAPSMGAGVSAPAGRGNGNRAAQPNELQCLKCFRTFPKKSYFDYHMSRTVCAKIPPTADGFRYSCTKCGQGFTHPGGLSYHNAKQVCEGGTNAASEPQQGNSPATPVPARGTASQGYPSNTQTPSSQTAKTSNAHVLPANRPGEVSSPKGFSPGANDPYGHLTQERMDQLNAELLQAEEQYSGRFREAEAIADPEQRRVRLDSLRNTFGTKQSMIRKKYGVRLRERRTRAEIQAERERMGRGPLADGQSPAAIQPRTSTSAWTAANAVVAPTTLDLTEEDSGPSLKRRRVDDEGNDQHKPPPPPRQQTGPTTMVSEMAGGLAASSTTAAVHDPTLPPPPSSTPSHKYQQAGARVEIHLPSKPSRSKPSSAAASTSGAPGGARSREPDSATPDIMETDHVPADEDGFVGADANGDGKESENENEVINIDDDSDDDDDDGDIPASLPPSVRQSLASSQLGSGY